MLLVLACLGYLIVGPLWLLYNPTLRKKWQSYLVLVLPFLAVFCAPMFGNTVRDFYLKDQLPKLEAVIDQKNQISDEETFYWKKARVTTSEMESGDKCRFVWWGSGFPAKHTVLGFHNGSPATAQKDFESFWGSVYHFHGGWWFVGN